ncbi:ethanolamine permease [Klebsiella variicola]|uniref:Ethanolamine permease n=1 Tax=Klebsiella variicola TaxID=244366 RepID=A0A7H4ME72_KLEVA|nr:ethanolamine permease [Klebsiella variicola]
MAIGAYLNVQFPALDPKWVACGAYVIFMTLNILGVGIAATFELIVTLLAIFELLVFMGVVAPGFSWSHFTTNGWAGAESFSGLALPGMFAAIPFAIWFFLAIEGASMAAEEAKDPQRTIPRALGGGILTLTVLAIGVMVFAGGVGDWRALSNINDPLPPGDEDGGGQWQRLAAYAGVAGAVWPRRLLPRHHYGLFAADLLPRPRRLSARRAGDPQPPHPHPASGDPRRRRGRYRRDLLRLADHHQRHAADRLYRHYVGIWAIVMYITSMAALFKLRRSEPKLIRPFRAPLYPLAPAFALGMAVLCLVAMVWYNLLLALIFAAMMLGGYLWFRKTAAARERAPVDPQLRTVS